MDGAGRGEQGEGDWEEKRSGDCIDAAADAEDSLSFTRLWPEAQGVDSHREIRSTTP
jgi:hypothetical protein